MKSTFQAESAFIQKRRQVYEEIAGAIRIFISGHFSEHDLKPKEEKFLHAYATAWLWSQDPALQALNTFVKNQMLFAQDPMAVSHADQKRLFSTCVLEMRKDAVLPSTGSRSLKIR